jgi:hypothetical protein
MENMKWVEKEVEAAMSSFEGLQRAEAPHFLFTRVEASLSRGGKGFWYNFALFLSKPVVTIAMVVVILCLNTLAYYNHNDVVVNIAEDDHAFAGEYSMVNNTTQDESVYALNEDQ